jgi:Histidine kinase
MVLGKTCHSTGAKTVAPANVIGHQEVDHRVANSSQLVSALLGLHARQSPSPEGRDALPSIASLQSRAFIASSAGRSRRTLSTSPPILSIPLQPLSRDVRVTHRDCALTAAVRDPSDIRETKGHGMRDIILITGSSSGFGKWRKRSPGQPRRLRQHARARRAQCTLARRQRRWRTIADSMPVPVRACARLVSSRRRKCKHSTTRPGPPACRIPRADSQRPRH